MTNHGSIDSVTKTKLDSKTTAFHPAVVSGEVIMHPIAWWCQGKPAYISAPVRIPFSFQDTPLTSSSFPQFAIPSQFNPAPFFRQHT